MIEQTHKSRKIIWEILEGTKNIRVNNLRWLKFRIISNKDFSEFRGEAGVFFFKKKRSIILLEIDILRFQSLLLGPSFTWNFQTKFSGIQDTSFRTVYHTQRVSRIGPGYVTDFTVNSIWSFFKKYNFWKTLLKLICELDMWIVCRLFPFILHYHFVMV